jgi:hypothetical protein
MSQWLESLSFDLLYWTASYLDVEDIVNLSNTSRHFRFLLGEPTLCRKILDVCTSLGLRTAIKLIDDRIMPTRHSKREMPRGQAMLQQLEDYTTVGVR